MSSLTPDPYGVGGPVADQEAVPRRSEPEPRRSVLHAEDGRSIGELLSSVTGNLSTLLQQEVALAKAEAKQSAGRAGKGIGLFVGGAVGGLLFLVFVSLSATYGLGQFLGDRWSALIVAVIWAIVAGVLALVGRNELKRMRGLDRTTETVSKIPNAVKGQEEANR